MGCYRDGNLPSQQVTVQDASASCRGVVSFGVFSREGAESCGILVSAGLLLARLLMDEPPALELDLRWGFRRLEVVRCERSEANRTGAGGDGGFGGALQPAVDVRGA